MTIYYERKNISVVTEEKNSEKMFNQLIIYPYSYSLFIPLLQLTACLSNITLT